ncbi:MAG: TonB-dependent receptor, partial [Acidobacteria bacterium]|nr:TonB-dependent receptor [Acidobacteriota bacterium]
MKPPRPSRSCRPRRARSWAQGIPLLFLIPLVLATAQTPAPKGTVRGEVYGASESGERQLIRGARVALTPASGLDPSQTPPDEVTTVTDEKGQFAFENIPSGGYWASASSSGMQGRNSQLCLVAPGGMVEVSIEMKLEVVHESVEVSAAQARPTISGADSTQTITAATLEDAPTVSERFESLLPLVPGVVRGPDGRINLKGTRATQDGLLVNSVNVTDPVTGASAVNLPVDVVSDVTVLSNPYDSQYGKFAGAITTVTTQVSDFNKFRFKVQNFLPGFRKRDGSWAGIEKFMPRLTMSGPVKKGRLALTQSLEYRYIRTEIEQAGLPPLERDTHLESFDSFSQADIQISERHTAAVSLSLYPQKQNYFGLNTFTPQAATPNLRQRGFLLGLQDTYVLRSGSLLKTRLHYKRFEADVRANSDDPYRLGIETTEGGFFNQQDRDTWRLEAEEVFHLAPRRAQGQHFLKAGVSFTRHHYNGDIVFYPIDVLGAGDRLVRRITFSDPTEVRVRQHEYTLFMQDQWLPHRRLTLDMGIRFDYDSITKDSHPAPRLGFAYLLTNDDRTVLRGGIGFFYDALNLAIPTFLDIPFRTETVFVPGELTATSVSFNQSQVRSDFRNPLSLGWSLHLDRELTSDWFLRTGFQQRVTTRDFFIQPESTPDGNVLVLNNAGRNRYREFELTTRYRLADRYHITASYVRSSTLGDLNDYNTVFGNIGQTVIRPNQRTRLPFDAPNRFLFWAEIRGSHGLLISPVLDLHTGYP